MFMRLSCQYAIIRSTVQYIRWSHPNAIIETNCEYRIHMRLSYAYAIIVSVQCTCTYEIIAYICNLRIYMWVSYPYAIIISIFYMSLLKCNYHIKMRLSDPFAIIMFTSYVIREKSKQISWHWPFKKNGEHIMFFVQYSAVPSAQKKIDSK